MATQKTLDILDNYFKKKVKKFMSIDADDRWDNTKVVFHLDPQYWDHYWKDIKKYNFTWHEFKYSDKPDLRTEIPTDDTGVYMFIVKSNNMVYSLPGFLLYVGIAGEGGSNRPLRTRLNDYFHVENIKKRKKLHRLIRRYYKNIYIAWHTFPAPGISASDLSALEKALHGFFIPPANDRDFPIEIKEIKQAQLTA